MLQRFFMLCSGADTSILENCSAGEKNKYAGIGATVFFTAIMAWIASSYALYTVFDNPYLAIGFGCSWGLLIFNLDRYIVSTIKKRDHFIDEFLQATPRLLLAIIIAIVISKPLELKLFEKEIDQVLLTQKNDLTLNNKDQIALQYTPKIEALQTEIENLKSAVVNKEQEVNSLYDTYISEAEGTAGTKRLGKGPVYKEKRDKHDMALAELQRLKTTNADKISALETDIAALQSDYNNQIQNSQPIIDGFDGLMARINALNTLPFLPSLFIFLLFLAVETSPIIVKLLAPKGPYDYKLEAIELQVKTETARQTQQLNVALQTDHSINDTVYAELSQEEELREYKKKLARELMKQQQEAFYRSQTKLL